MALSKKENAKKSKKYYDENKAYREKKKKDRLTYAKAHHKEEAEQSREYYHSNPKYKSYKKKYASEYRKRNKKKYLLIAIIFYVANYIAIMLRYVANFCKKIQK